MYEPVGDTPAIGKRKERWRAEILLSAVGSIAYWSLPGLRLDAAHCLCFFVIVYAILIVLTVFYFQSYS